MDVETKAQTSYKSISPIKTPVDNHSGLCIYWHDEEKSRIQVYLEFPSLSYTYQRCHFFAFPVFLTLPGKVDISFNSIMKRDLFLLTYCMVIECLWIL